MDNALGALLAGSLVILAIAVVLSIVFYVLWSIGCYKVLKKLGFQNAWMAWIPVVSYIALGLACNTEDNKTMNLFGLDIPTVVYALWIVIWFVAGRIPGAGGVVSLAVQILLSGRIYQYIYAKLEGKKESETAVIGFLSGWLGIIPMIKFLGYKD